MAAVLSRTTFYRQHLCGGQCTQEQSQPQHTWNSKLFVIFPAEFAAAQSHISNILCGLRLWIQDAYSKEKPFVSNVHINILKNISLQEQFSVYPAVL